MADIHLLFAHAETVERSDCSEESAAKFLELAAGYLERREVMPEPLADFISTAFRIAASVEPEQRPTKLASLLNLTALNKRPAFTKIEIDGFMLWHVFRAASIGQSETKTIAGIAKAQGVSLTTARTYLKEWRRRNQKINESIELLKTM